MSNFPSGFKQKVIDIYTADPRLPWVQIGEQALIELKFEGSSNSKALSDKVRNLIGSYKRGSSVIEQGAVIPTTPYVPKVVDESVVGQVWVKRKKGTYQFTPDKAMSFQQVLEQLEPEEGEGKTWEQRIQEHVEATKQYAPAYPVIDRTPYPDGHLLVVSPTDIHIGKLASAFETGEEYNNQIAVQRALEGVRGIIKKAQGFNIDQVLFVIGNDILHIDTPKRLTTGGTPQDTDGMWYDNYLIAKRLYIEIIEMLLTVADVHIQYDPSNHDYTNGFFLADTITSWFGRCKNVTFDTDIKHRKYFSYHKNLIGTTHGDGAKTADLPLLMAHEEPVNWGICKHRYFYTGHLHHKVSKDYMSVCVETLRSPSSADSWHSRNGYQYAPVAIEGFVHSKEHGQICRLTHIFTPIIGLLFACLTHIL